MKLASFQKETEIGCVGKSASSSRKRDFCLSEMYVIQGTLDLIIWIGLVMIASSDVEFRINGFFHVWVFLSPFESNVLSI